MGNEDQEYIGVEQLENGSMVIRVVEQSGKLQLSDYAANTDGSRGSLMKSTENFNFHKRPWYVTPVQTGKPV